mmetsp:Transcript_17604/g.54840  ORF Transcript_17604/g.54840 Transcript_17604/m.54840 type:complete len:321 (+) Transcript_17604:690-1652(+)
MAATEKLWQMATARKKSLARYWGSRPWRRTRPTSAPTLLGSTQCRALRTDAATASSQGRSRAVRVTMPSAFVVSTWSSPANAAARRRPYCATGMYIHRTAAREMAAKGTNKRAGAMPTVSTSHTREDKTDNTLSHASVAPQPRTSTASRASAASAVREPGGGSVAAARPARSASVCMCTAVRLERTAGCTPAVARATMSTSRGPSGHHAAHGCAQHRWRWRTAKKDATLQATTKWATTHCAAVMMIHSQKPTMATAPLGTGALPNCAMKSKSMTIGVTDSCARGRAASANCSSQVFTSSMAHVPSLLEVARSMACRHWMS